MGEPEINSKVMCEPVKGVGGETPRNQQFGIFTQFIYFFRKMSILRFSDPDLHLVTTQNYVLTNSSQNDTEICHFN